MNAWTGVILTITPLMFSLGCSSRERSAATASGGPVEPSREGTDQADASASAQSDSGQASVREACLDAWLSKRKLDPYGNPEGTMYAGGTPLFDERTGEARDRFDYVFERHPEARAACGGSSSSPAAPGAPGNPATQ